MRLTYEEFINLFPLTYSSIAAYAGLSTAMPIYKIDDNACREAYFLGQLAHETGGFKYIHELGSSQYFQRYDGRLDLGNTKPGDGYRYRGRGYIQLTGRYNYDKFGKLLNIDLLDNPDWATKPSIAALIAADYWYINKLNDLADKQDIVTITKRINGGKNGLQDRINWTNMILHVIKDR